MATLPLIVFDVNETLLDLGTWSRPSCDLWRQERNAPLVRELIMSPRACRGRPYVPFTDMGQ